MSIPASVSWTANDLMVFFQCWKKDGQLTNIAQIINKSQEEVESLFNKHKSLLSLENCTLEVFIAAFQDMEIIHNFMSQDFPSAVVEGQKQNILSSPQALHKRFDNQVNYPAIFSAEPTVSSINSTPVNPLLELQNAQKLDFVKHDISDNTNLPSNDLTLLNSEKDCVCLEELTAEKSPKMTKTAAISVLQSRSNFPSNGSHGLLNLNCKEETCYDDSRAVSLFYNFVNTVSERKFRSSKSTDSKCPVSHQPIRKCTSMYQVLLKALNPNFQSPSGGLRFWAICEFFYSYIDRGWYAQNEFLGCLHALRLVDIKVATRRQWNVIRKMMGNPRRFSQAFLKSERAKLKLYRDSKYQEFTVNFSKSMSLFELNFCFLRNGEPCLALRVKNGHLNICPGFVESYDWVNRTYLVSIDDEPFQVSGEMVMSRDFSKLLLHDCENLWYYCHGICNNRSAYCQSPFKDFTHNYCALNSAPKSFFGLNNFCETDEFEKVYYLKMLMKEQTDHLQFLSKINDKAETAKAQDPNVNIKQLFSIDQQKQYASSIKILSLISEIISEKIKTYLLTKEAKAQLLDMESSTHTVSTNFACTEHDLDECEND